MGELIGCQPGSGQRQQQEGSGKDDLLSFHSVMISGIVPGANPVMLKISRS
jgi:hypothetical protein